MNSTSRFMLILVLIALAGGAGFWMGRHHGAPEANADAPSTEPAEDEKVATVSVAPVREGEISDQITAYGSVLADPGEVRVLSVPFECRVSRVLATPGEEVAADADVIIVDASPDTKVALKDAENALDAAKRDLDQIKQRFEQHLATQQEMSSAELSLKSGQLKVQSLVERGADKLQHLKSPMAGVISKVDVQEGQIIAAGSPLMEIAAQNRIQVKLGVEPTDAPYLKAGQTVQLHRLEGSSDEIEGKIRFVGKRVDPTTRLVEVLVILPPDAHLILDSFIAGEITRQTARGLIVPREAILAEEGGEHAIFTVEDGKAKEHKLHTGIETKREVQITADDVKAGDTVVTVGALELEDGMKVEVKEATTEPTTEPATAPATKSSRETSSLSPVLGGEGRGEGLATTVVQIAQLSDENFSPLSPTLSPAYRGEGVKQAEASP